MKDLQTIDGPSLMAMTFEPARFLVPGIIPEGLTLLGGKPKIGKSWLALQIAICSATGGTCLGRKVGNPGNVLYLALEDGPRRLQSRLALMLGDRQPSARIQFATACPALDNGGAKLIERWTDQADNPRLIVVDVLARIRAKSTSGPRLYDSDYAAALPLKAIADRHNLAVLVIHHTRKAEAESDPLDSLSATTGLAGAADHVVVIDRTKAGTTLYARGRDAPEVDLAIDFDGTTGLWRILGNADEVARSDQRNAILRAVGEAGEPIGPKNIAELSKVKHDVVKQLVLKMVAAGDLRRVKPGLYSTPVHFDHHVHSPSPSSEEGDGMEVNADNGVNGIQARRASAAAPPSSPSAS